MAGKSLNHFESKCAAMTIFLGASGSNVYTRLVKSTSPIGVDPVNGVYGVRPVVAGEPLTFSSCQPSLEKTDEMYFCTRVLPFYQYSHTSNAAT